MRPCIIGIGGTGGKVLKEFLRNEDISILGVSLGEHIAFGGIKGIWVDFSTDACDSEEKFYPGRLEEGKYPGFIVPPEVIKQSSRVREYIQEEYGFDLRKQGFDRRAESLKAIAEIFQIDPTVKSLSREEYSGAENPLLAYLWSSAISKFVTIAKVAGQQISELGNGFDLKSQGDMEDGAEERRGSGVNDSSGSAAADPSSQEETASNGGLVKNGISAMESITRGRRSILSRLMNRHDGNVQNVCESLLFIASLGGGTGTGFINPLTSFIRTRGSLLALALCLFTEKGTDSKHTSEGHRDLGAIIAMYDLLVKRRDQGIDGLILVDNQMLQGNFGSENYSAINRAVFKAMRPLIDRRRFPGVDDESLGIQRVFLEKRECPGIFVPCHYSIDSPKASERELVLGALKEGKLFPCNPKKADQAYIFSRGLLDPSILERELKAAICGGDGREKTVYVYPKIGDIGSAEILILLRNPYGDGDALSFSRDTCNMPCKNEGEWRKSQCGTLEQRIYCAICMALRYLTESESEIIKAGMKPLTKAAVGGYFFGPRWIDKNLRILEEKSGLSDGDKRFRETLQSVREQYAKAPFLVQELENSLGRLERGERPIFRRELNIFAGSSAEEEEANHAEEEEAVFKRLKPLIRSEIRNILAREYGHPPMER